VDVPLVSVVEAGAVGRVRVRDADDLVINAFEAHREEIFTFLARSTRDDAEAEDLVQETFLRLAREVRAGRTPDQVRAWLYRVAGNLAASRFRHRAVARRWLERVASLGGEREAVESPEAGLLGHERFAEMERALREVSEEARVALLLAAQGFSGREIARSLGKSEVATRALMMRARLRIRSQLAGREP
ncbi:MAG: RNA polymerase sigma factor, partial [Thermoleophilaceae bacterium]